MRESDSEGERNRKPSPAGTKNISRRELVRQAGRLAYVAPTLVIFSMAATNAAASTPPDSPGGDSFEPVDGECSQWLSPDCID